jgi:hypothetical protein
MRCPSQRDCNKSAQLRGEDFAVRPFWEVGGGSVLSGYFELLTAPDLCSNTPL